MELVFKPPEEVNTGGAEQQSATQHQQCNISDTHTVEKLKLKMLEKGEALQQTIFKFGL